MYSPILKPERNIARPLRIRHSIQHHRRAALIVEMQVGLCKAIAKPVRQLWPPVDTNFCPLTDTPASLSESVVFRQGHEAVAAEVFGSNPEE